MNQPGLVRVPAHVPKALVRDVDYFDLPGAEDDPFLARWTLQQNEPDIFWTPRNGGHWILTRGDDLYKLFAEVELLSNRQIMIPATPGALPLLPIESDGTMHDSYRKLIQPWFSPRYVNNLAAEVARPLAIELIERLRPQGECEFIQDFAKQLPIVVFLTQMGLPTEDKEMLVPLVDEILRTSDMAARARAAEQIGAYITENIEKRRDSHDGGLMSAVIHAQFDGRPATGDEVYGFCYNLLYGGLDTVTSTMGFIARFLADSPAHRQQLVENPSLIPKAITELLRRFGVSNSGKQAAKDFIYKSVHFQKGDMVQFQTVMHGLDDRKFERPLEVDFNRPPPISSVFGNGPHRCPGSYVARMEIALFLEEWLKHIPDFGIKRGEKPVCGGGVVTAMLYLPLEW